MVAVASGAPTAAPAYVPPSPRALGEAPLGTAPIPAPDAPNTPNAPNVPNTAGAPEDSPAFGPGMPTPSGGVARIRTIPLRKPQP